MAWDSGEYRYLEQDAAAMADPLTDAEQDAADDAARRAEWDAIDAMLRDMPMSPGPADAEIDAMFPDDEFPF